MFGSESGEVVYDIKTPCHGIGTKPLKGTEIIFLFLFSNTATLRCTCKKHEKTPSSSSCPLTRTFFDMSN